MSARHALALSLAGAACVATQRTDVRVRVSVQPPPTTLVVAGSARVVTPPTRAVIATPPTPPPPPPLCGEPRVDGEAPPELVSIAAGRMHSCALLADGFVRCWGYNLDGETGNGETGTDVGPGAPVESRGLANAAQLCASDMATCARRVDGSVWCWGNNSWDEVDDLAVSAVGRPHAVRGVRGATTVACGGRSTCAVLRGGTLRCWGLIAGDRRRETVRLPGRAVDVALGADHACARTADGRVLCWTARSPTPVAVQGLDAPVTHLALGERVSCARMSDGRVACWGEGYRGELGTGVAQESARAVVVPSLEGVVSLSAFEHRVCATTQTGALWCWGPPSTSSRREVAPPIAAPARVEGVAPVLGVAVGDRHVCARMRAGGACCWGSNAYGQLGDNTRDDRAAPTPVTW